MKTGQSRDEKNINTFFLLSRGKGGNGEGRGGGAGRDGVHGAGQWGL